MKDSRHKEILDNNQNISCKNCKYFNTEITGVDEYPQCATITTCLKGYWENGDLDQTGYSYWNNCNDYESS